MRSTEQDVELLAYVAEHRAAVWRSWYLLCGDVSRAVDPGNDADVPELERWSAPWSCGWCSASQRDDLFTRPAVKDAGCSD